jgi:acetylornithine deacetylase/succinyl-diaminopimelate desuccinylase-like protein
MDIALYKSLADGIDEAGLQARLMEMLAVRSENPFDSEPRAGYREKEMGQYYLEAMDALGMAVTSVEVLPDRPNVFGRRKGHGAGPSLMLAGHMDTAPSEGYRDAYRITRDNGRITGRGACDMKAALAAYLEVVRILETANVRLKGDLLLGAIADEEHRMAGSRHVGRNGPRADQGIIGEPSNLTVCTANKGQLGTIIRTFGRAVHSSIPEKGVNAIVHMAAVIDAFSGYNSELMTAEPHPLCGHARFNPGVIRGGTIVSTVPDCCELEVDRRVLPGDTTEEVFAELRKRLDPLKDKIPGFRYEITPPTWDIPANDVPLDTPVVGSLLAGYAQVMGRNTRAMAFAAGTDAPNLGFPTVICGPGSIAQAHGKDEYVAVEQLTQAVKIYLWAVLDLLA